MILDGKYLILDKHNILKVLNILYKMGYNWERDKLDVVVLFKSSTYDQFHIYSVDNVLHWGGCFSEAIINRNHVKTQTLFREYKLKRILK